MPLPSLSPLRLILPVCLGLGILLTAFPGGAQAPIASARTVAVGTRALPLRHADPVSLLQTMHWDHGRDLPDGVTRIRALPKENALSVTATPAGFAGFQELVALLDVAPRRVQLKFALAHATAADLQTAGLHSLDLVPVTRLGVGTASPSGLLGMASGASAGQLLRTLTRRKAVLLAPVLVTTNNAEARLSVSGAALMPGWKIFTFAATPRVNSDHSITLRLHPALSKRSPGHPATATQAIQTLRTVRSGETLALINLFPQAANGLVLFVTPTALPK